MFIAVNNVKGIKYVVLRENVYDENGKRQQKTLKSFGRLDKLLEKDPKALEKLKQKYRELTEKKRDEARREALAQELKGIELNKDDKNEKPHSSCENELRMTPNPLLCYGLCLLRPIWSEHECPKTHHTLI